MENLTTRTEILIGEDGVMTLADKSVTLVGVGGVGGYVATLLVRAGVGHITLVDFDKVAPSNLNRQVVATLGTVGRSKVEVLKEMLLNINANLDCTIHDCRLTDNNVDEIIKPCDICIDCIDSVKDKLALIVYCKSKGIEIISAMGAGNRMDIPRFYLTDIFKTSGDGLAKAMRKKLREAGVKSLDVVTSESQALKVEGTTVGSISYYPAMCGITLAAVVVNRFLKEK